MITKYELGIIAIAIGWLVGLAVVWGAGRKRGIALQILSTGITLIAMMFSEYLIVRHFIVEILKEEGYTSFQLLLPVGDMLMLVIEGIKAGPISLLFWAIALFQAWKLPAQRRLHTV